MTKKAIEIFQVDSFTSEPFRGNPAAVCLLQGPADATWMQAVAAEMNLSETAFLWPESDGYRLRWFTPEVEVELCGHATLASAHVLWETGAVASQRAISFYTLSGRLTASPAQGGGELDFPAAYAEPAELPAEVASAFPATPLSVVRVPEGRPLAGRYLLELASEQAVRELTPQLAGLRYEGAPDVVITARSAGGNWDFVSRFFAPGLGVEEDPVTGSAHCLLATFWCTRLGKNTLTGYQVSRRGGMVGVTLADTRVKLRGQAVTVLRGHLLVGAGA